MNKSTKPERSYIASFTLEVDDNGLPSAKTLEMASYLIELLKTNPPTQNYGVIHLTGNETQLEVRQEFKRVTGMTAVEDIFIHLPQAKERQEIKDCIDEWILSTNLISDGTSVESLEKYAELIGFSELYKKSMTALSNSKIRFGQNFGDNDGTFNGFTKYLGYNLQNGAVTLIHELVHAYIALESGSPLNARDDEAVAHVVVSALSVLRNELWHIENQLKSGNFEQAQNAWNRLMGTSNNGDYSFNRHYLNGINFAYLWFGKRYPDNKTNINDFRNTKKYLGLDLSNNFFNLYAAYLNSTYSVNFTVPNNISF